MNHSQTFSMPGTHEYQYNRGVHFLHLNVFTPHRGARAIHHTYQSDLKSFLGSQILERRNVACLNKGRTRGRCQLTRSRQSACIHSWLLVGKLCLAWRGAGGGEWSLFESLCQIFVLFLEWDRAPTSQRQPRQSAHERRVGSRAAWNQSSCKKGQRGEDTICSRTPLASHASSAFHATHSSPSPASTTGNSSDQPAHTLDNPVGKWELRRWSRPRRPSPRYTSLPTVSLSRLQSAGIKRVFKYLSFFLKGWYRGRFALLGVSLSFFKLWDFLNPAVGSNRHARWGSDLFFQLRCL